MQIYADKAEGSSYLEIYFDKEGQNTYKGIKGTKKQILWQIGIADDDNFESNIQDLIGKSVEITKDDETGWITGMEIIIQASNFKLRHYHSFLMCLFPITIHTMPTVVFAAIAS